jgi:HEAT repeat protein
MTGDTGDRLAALAAQLGHADWEQRRQAAVALGHARDGRALPALRDALADPDEVVRKEAAWALGTLGDRRAIAALLGALADPDLDVVDRAHGALEQFGPAVTDGAIAALGDASPEVRWRAAALLGKVGDARALVALEQVQAQDSTELWLDTRVRDIASQAMDQIRQRQH